jgi:alpha-L-fucosidase 2
MSIKYLNRKCQLAVILSVTVLIASVDAAEKSPMKSLSTLSSLDHAKQHPIVCNRPAVNFFEGAILGNGGLGAIVTTRPDAVVIRFGHNDVWDIRLAEDNRDKIGTFQQVFDKLKAIGKTVDSLNKDQWFASYCTMCRENYQKPYPRPFPCGSVVLWFDRRKAELLGHSLAIDSGLCTVHFLIGGEKAQLQIFADMEEDKLWLRMVNEAGQAIKSPFIYITMIPDAKTPAELPKYTAAKVTEKGILSFRQILPSEEITDKNPYKERSGDKAFCLTARINTTFDDSVTEMSRGQRVGMGPLESSIVQNDDFVMCVQLDNGQACNVKLAGDYMCQVDSDHYNEAAKLSRTVWENYWQKSAVALDDEVLERTWYQNLYFLRCALRAKVTCPGLFANWSLGDVGTAWHGDYHLNYNLEQPFWVTFSSNHVDLDLPYVDMLEDILLPMSQKWAKDYYGLRGACFPHSAYPVMMTMSPYPVPTWGWEVCETPWAVQSLWWHYTYTMDEIFLRKRALPIIKEAVMFLVDYMKRPEAHGAGWDDDKYHIYPSVPPELYGLRPGFDKNYDTMADLALTRFVFDAYLKACKILDLEDKEGETIANVRDILEHFPYYPTAQSQNGEVFVSVKGEDPAIVYNCPVSLMTVFPGELHGLDSRLEDYEIAVNTYRNQQNEGGNDIVFLNLQAARLGLLDLEKFKRQIEYCLLPDGTCTDKALQIHGRYANETKFDYMAKMGIWFENFALPVVINECMLQSYNNKLRFFPNWPKDKEAEFRRLRAVGAFLVSSKYSNGSVQWIEVLSEAGEPLNIINPWGSGILCKRLNEQETLSGKEFTIETEPGEVIQFKPVQ